MYLLAIVVSYALAVARGMGHTEEAFQAVAHLWVGLLLGLWLANRKANRRWLWMAVALSAVEVICFLASRLLAAF